jgi:hypothetical protein
MLISAFWMPKATLAASIKCENCSTRSLTGSRICPGANVTPTPKGCTDASVPCATEITALSSLAVAKLTSARLRPASTCCMAGASSGASQAQAVNAAMVKATRALRITGMAIGMVMGMDLLRM